MEIFDLKPYGLLFRIQCFSINASSLVLYIFFLQIKKKLLQERNRSVVSENMVIIIPKEGNYLFYFHSIWKDTILKEL